MTRLSLLNKSVRRNISNATICDNNRTLLISYNNLSINEKILCIKKFSSFLRDVNKADIISGLSCKIHSSKYSEYISNAMKNIGDWRNKIITKYARK